MQPHTTKAAPHVEKAKADYQAEFRTFSNAGTGVILTRAREPFRVISALREVALHAPAGTAFKLWNMIGGWHAYDMTKPEAPPVKDKMLNPQVALKSIGELDGDGTKAWGDGVYVMDGIHCFLGANGNPGDPTSIAILRHYAYAFATTQQRVVIVAPESFVLPPELQHDIPVIDYDLPDRGELGAVLAEVIESAFPDGMEPVEIFSQSEREAVVASASGMTRLEAESAFAQAIVRNMAEFPSIPFDAFNRTGLHAKTDVVKRSDVLELMKPGRLEDVGGLDNLKEWIALRKKCFTKEAADFGADTPKGIALIGPPGTGKSISAKAIAASLGQPLIRFDVSRVFGSLIGQTEGRVRAALKQLEAMAPCVAFIDEIDKAGLDPRQSGGDSGVSKRVMGSILTFMQESTAPIFWLFTANRVDGLPPELLRKGRLDEVFSVLPPNAIERKQVLHIHLRARKQDPDAIKDLSAAVDASLGYVSAEIEAAVKEAVIVAFNNGGKVTGRMIADQLENMKPLSEAFPEDFQSMKAWAENNARPASPPEDADIPRPVAPRPRRRVHGSES